MNNQDQNAKENSTAIQAGHDANIVINQNISYAEIKEIVKDLFEKNFPVLVNTAAEKAKHNIEEYLDRYLFKMADKIEKEKYSKLALPDVQFVINDILKSVARYGKDIDHQLLTDLLIEKINSDDNFIDINIIFDKAISVIPSLGQNQIKLLPVDFFVKNIKFPYMGNKDILISEIETYSKNILESINFDNIFTLKNRQISMLSALGLCTQRGFVMNPIDHFKNLYKEISDVFDETNLRENMPFLYNMIEIFKRNDLGYYTFNSVAYLIAITVINRNKKIFDLDKYLI
jgi:hypothetical protein